MRYLSPFVAIVLLTVGISLGAEPWAAKDSMHQVTLDVRYGELRDLHYQPRQVFAVQSEPWERALYPFDMLFHFYEKHVTPLDGATCRYHPTCSQYTKEALQRFGLAVGVVVGVERFMRCHEWQDDDVHDPVKIW